MSTAPLFDMSKATPIEQPSHNAKPLFDMSKATPIEHNAPSNLKLVDERDPLGLEKDEQGNIYYQGRKLDPKSFAPTPPGLGAALLRPSVIPVAGGIGFGGAAASEAAGPSILGKVGQGIVQAGKSLLPSAGATVEETAANVTKWAAEKGLKGAGIWYLLHHFLGGKE